MKYRDNANLTTFLLGQKVYLTLVDDNNQFVQEFQLKMPTIADLYCDTKLQTMLGILKTPIDKLQQDFQFIKNFNYYTLLTTLKLYEKIRPEVKRILSCIEYGFEVFGLTLDIAEKLYVDGEPIDEETLMRLRALILYMAKLEKKIEDDPMMRNEQYRKSQELINRIKSQGKKANENINGFTNADENFKKNYIILAWEFHLSPAEIQALNIYQYETILSYTNGAINTKIGMIAAGNGLSKKFKYITEGGK